MDLNVQYIRDLPIPNYGEWTDAESHNWLHPSNGPLPDLHGMLDCMGGTFIGAVWDDYESLVVFLFLQDDDDSEAYRIMGGIPRTYRWRLHENYFVCGKEIVHTPQWEGDEQEWQMNLMRKTLKRSVKLALTVPVGIRSESQMSQLLRRASDLPGKAPSRRRLRSPSTPSAIPSTGKSHASGAQSTRRLLPSLKKEE